MSLPGTSGMPHAAAPGNFRPIALSNTCQKLIAKALNSTLEVIAHNVVHRSQRGFVGGRRMGDNILLTLVAMEKALMLGEARRRSTFRRPSLALVGSGYGRFWRRCASRIGSSRPFAGS